MVSAIMAEPLDTTCQGIGLTVDDGIVFSPESGRLNPFFIMEIVELRPSHPFISQTVTSPKCDHPRFPFNCY